MPDPSVFADAVAGIGRVDSGLAGIRAEFLVARDSVIHHRTRCAGVCEDMKTVTATLRDATLAVDGLLDERLELMRVRDLEVLWLASGGADSLTVDL